MPTYYPPGRRKGNTTYVVRGYAGKRQREIATDATNQRTAEQEWKQFKRDADRQYHESASGTPQTFTEAARSYLEFRDPSKNDRRYIDALIAEIGTLELSMIQQHNIVKAANRMYPTASNATKNRQTYVPAACVLHYAAENDWRHWIRIKKLKEPRPETRAVSPKLAKALLKNADKDMLLLLTFLFRQGTRITDTLQIKWEDVNLKTATVRYYVSKTDEWREAPLHTDVVRLLMGNEGVGFIFHWRSRWGVYKALEPLRKATGIHFTPHQARHSFATWLVNEGVSLPELMEAGGWKDAKSVIRYGKVDQDRVREVIHRAGNRGNPKGKKG